MDRVTLNTPSRNDENRRAFEERRAAGQNCGSVEPLEGRVLMSASVLASPGTIALDKAAIVAELRQIKVDQFKVKSEIASARERFLTVTLPADEAAIKSARRQYQSDANAHGIAPASDFPAHPGDAVTNILISSLSFLPIDEAAIVTARAHLASDRGALFSKVNVDVAEGSASHAADESALNALELKLKADSTASD